LFEGVGKWKYHSVMTNMSATTKSDLEVLKFYQERGTSEARKSVEDKNE